MLRIITVTILLTLCLSLVASGESLNRQVSPVKPATISSPVRTVTSSLDEVIYFENFETGLNGWVSEDLTARTSTWHLDAFSAFGGSGTSWWVGDPSVGTNGGYNDAWYQVLDSPPIQLGATPTLRFMHRYACENPAGATAPYNGWDGMNLRISINGGTTWTIIPTTALVPAYDRTSLFSFGSQHGEGPNIPGWCGATAGATWHVQTANLSAWANQTVLIRWAFASDPAESTPQNPTWFGWMVDNIRVHNGADTVFSSDANDATGWIGHNMVPLGGDLWRIANDPTSPYGANIIVCNNPTTELYNTNMDNVLVSPYIDLRGRPNGIVMADFAVTGSLELGGGCPGPSVEGCDYWGIDVSSDSGLTWCAISNPTCDTSASANNYVYTDCPPTWAGFDTSYSTPMDMSAFIGQVIKFRFQFQSAGTADVDYGPKMDGFKVDYTAGFPNDISCYTLQVRYPNVVGVPTKIKAYFRNTGSDPQSAVQAYYKVTGRPNSRFQPNLVLDPGVSDFRTANLAFTAVTTVNIQAWSQLGTDQFPANDSSMVTDISVQPATDDWTIGYDNRTFRYRFDYNTGQGPLVHFTPVQDTVCTHFDLNTIKALFDGGQTSDEQIRMHLYAGDNSNLPGTQIANQLITVATTEVGNVWKEIDVSAIPETRNMSTNFWVWFEVTNTAAEDRYPQITGDSAEVWTDVHNFTWGGTSNPLTSSFFYQIHADIHSLDVSAEDPDAIMPITWNLEQNYPNPFNPVTEIHYSVPRSEALTLKVYNVVGQEVMTLVNGTVQPGNHTASFNGAGLSSGVYFYRLESASFTACHKMLLLK